MAALVAIPLGVGIALWEWVEDTADPVVEFLRPIPPIAWIPLGILWFGIGDAQNMFIIFLGAFFPILLNTIAGVRRVDRTLVWGALTLGGRRAQIIREIVLPGALPLILTGLRIGLGVGWMALVAAELVAARSGLGFMIQSARYAFLTERVILGMAVIGLLGLAMDRAMRGVQQRLAPWAAVR
jgi:ABC-type nitrate/sulfonate/bicarbonate transport system permease component